eukprot:308379_1
MLSIIKVSQHVEQPLYHIQMVQIKSWHFSVPSILIAVLSFIESIAAATKFADKHNYNIDASKTKQTTFNPTATPTIFNPITITPTTATSTTKTTTKPPSLEPTHFPIR